MARNYKAEYAAETPKLRQERASRNRARYRLMKAGSAKVGDGKDVDHRNGNPMDNSAGNIRAISKAQNLARKRRKRGGLMRG